MAPVNYALRADHQDFAGGQVAFGPKSETFDIGAALKEGGGVITIDPATVEQQTLVELLNAYPALKHVASGEADRLRVAVEPTEDTEPSSSEAEPEPEPEPKVEESTRSAAHTPAEHGNEQYDRETLDAMEESDLFDIADDRGLDTTGDENKETLVDLILNNQEA